MFRLLVERVLHQVLGTWTFHLGANDGDRMITCGYNRPDSNLQHFTNYNYRLRAERQVEVKLSEPNVATIVGTGQTGTWTMLYDEGFEVKVNGEVVCCFSWFFRFRLLYSTHNDVFTIIHIHIRHPTGCSTCN